VRRENLRREAPTAFVVLLRLVELPEELTARESVYLTKGYVSASLDPDSLRILASARRQVRFGVTLTLSMRAATIKWVSELMKETEDSRDLSMIVLAVKPSGRLRGWYVSPYTDVLPTNISLFLDPSVPDKVGPMALRYRELAAEVRKLKGLGAKVPPSTLWEMDRLSNVIWSQARRARRLKDEPGFVVAEYPSPSGVRRLSLPVMGADTTLSEAIKALHAILSRTIGAPSDPAAARELTTAFIEARAKGQGETKFRARMTAKIIGEGGINLVPSEKVKRMRSIRGWGPAPEELATAVRNLTGGLFEARLAGVTGDGVWVPLRGEATLRVRWEPRPYTT